MSGAQGLVDAFGQLAQVMPLVQFPLPIDGAAELRQVALAVNNQLRDYLLPRARRLDAPLLVVVGGSTGAGKSTLVNSLLRTQIATPGVLRPTTRSPVLICHPDDEAWFRADHILPSLVRTDTHLLDSRALRIVPFAGLSPGLALLDAPDIDSVDDANRTLAKQLLLAADLWLFVTSAARYADAVPWDYLAMAAERDTVISVVVNRVPPGAVTEIGGHLTQMLTERGLTRARLFAIEERRLASDGLLPEEEVARIRRWLVQLATETEARAQVAVQGLAGSVRSLHPQLGQLDAGLVRQYQAAAELREQAAAQFRQAAADVAKISGDGSMLRGEILGRWQDLVGTGEFMRSIEKRIAALRDRIGDWLRGTPQVQAVEVAIRDNLAAVLIEAGQQATEATASAWSRTPWGRGIIEAQPALRHPGESFPADVAAAIRAWQGDVLSLVDEQGRGRRMKARLLALGSNIIGAALIIYVFALTGGLTGAEVGIAGGASLLAQRILEAVFGEDAVRRLAEEARRLLDDRVSAVLSGELARYEAVLDTLAVDEAASAQLGAAMAALRVSARDAFDSLTTPEVDQ